MSSEDETLDPLTGPVNLCCALTLYLLLIRNPKSPLSLAIKLANGVLKTSIAFNYIKSPFPSPPFFFFASKAAFKGFKFFKHKIPSTGSSSSSISIRNFKSFIALANLIRYAHQPFYSDFSKFGKNLVRVMDVFLGCKIDGFGRRSLDALGVLFKAVVVVNLIRDWVRKNGRDCRGDGYCFLRFGGLRSGICLRCAGSCFDGFCVGDRVSCFKGLDFGYGDESRGDLEFSLSELLSLSIPIIELDLPDVLLGI